MQTKGSSVSCGLSVREGLAGGAVSPGLCRRRPHPDSISMADAPPFAENRAKVIAAFFLAPVIPAILDGFWLIWTEGDLNHPDMRPLGWFLYGAYPTVFLFGIPCYAVFKDVIAPSALNCVLFGAAIAGIPWALLSFFAGDWHGVLYFAKFSVLPGALGGLIFWAIATSGQKAPWR